MLTVGRASRSRHARPIFLALGLALLLAIGACAASVRRDRTDAAQQRTASARQEQPARYETVASICANHSRYRCLWTDDGRLAVLARAEDHAEQSPTILLDLGGPGVDVISVLGLLPAWARSVNLVVIPEDWTLGCPNGERRPCGDRERRSSDPEFVAAVEQANRTWGAFDGMIGFSYGAVRLLSVLERPAFSTIPVMLIAPAPPPDVRGDAWADARQANAERVLRRQFRSAPGLDPLLDGRRGVSRSTAQMAIVGLTTDPRDNGAFLGDVLRSDRSLTTVQRQAVEAAARSVILAGRTSALARSAYFAEICSRYHGWGRARTAFGRWHSRECTRASGPPISPSERARVGQTELWINTDDPVTGQALQRRWASWWPQVDVHYFADIGHDFPPAESMNGFLDRVSHVLH